jgi:hypothetical protein
MASGFSLALEGLAMMQSGTGALALAGGGRIPSLSGLSTTLAGMMAISAGGAGFFSSFSMDFDPAGTLNSTRPPNEILRKT